MYILKILVFTAWFEINFAQRPRHGNIPTSVTTMAELLPIEQSYIMTLESYGNALYRKMNIIRSALAGIRSENEKALKDPQRYLSIPLNVFALIRRLRQDWIYWVVYLRAPLWIAPSWRLNATLPHREDFSEAVNGINRLKRVYKLKAQDLAVGIINAKKYDSNLTALDCHAVAVELMRGADSRSNYRDAIEWIYTALHIYEDDLDRLVDVFHFSRLTVYRTYIELVMHFNITTLALRAINSALTLYPHNTQLLLWKSELDLTTKIGTPSSRTVMATNTTDFPFFHNLHVSSYPINWQPMRPPPQDFESACRGEYLNKTTKMYCIYNTTTTPFLKLAPIKMEIISLDPYLVVLYDILYDKEIEVLINMSIPFLWRAGIGGNATITHIRTSKNTWVAAGLNNTTKKIFTRMEDMTGFKFHNESMLQTQNYGLGGYYISHFDYYGRESIDGRGDRKASLMLYMNDVEQGGATAFPVLKYAYFPKKGTAVLWYNLNERLEPDNRTLHAGCPVIVGSKWVANQWIRGFDQMFTAPCYNK